MQVRRYSEEYLGKRTRYYQSTIDFGALQAGRKYNELKESIIIFICPFPVCDKKRHLYTFRNFCEQDKDIALKDGSTKIILSSKGTLNDVDPDVLAFLDYVDGKPVQNAFIEDIDKEIKGIKVSEKEKVNYMTYQMKIDEEREEAYAEGEAKGFAQGEAKGINTGISGTVALLRDLGRSNEQIMSSIQKQFNLTEEAAKSFLVPAQMGD